MSRNRKADKRGRSRGSMGSFVAVERYIMQTPAWRSLKPVDRAAYLELAYCYDGSNNGSIQMSARTMGERLGMDKATASRAIKELEAHGFIETARHSSFRLKLKLAAEYRLTAYKCDATGALPSKAFLKWKPEIQNTVAPAQLHGCAPATEAQKRRRKQAEQLHPRNREASNLDSDSCTHAPLLYSNHVAAASMTVQPGAANPQASAPANKSTLRAGAIGAGSTVFTASASSWRWAPIPTCPPPMHGPG
jgi:hypothetical protein